MKTEMEIQNENLIGLLNLIAENPELPIVPLVNYEVVAGDEALYWLASWGKAEIDSYCMHDEKICCLSDDRNDLFELFFELPDGMSVSQEEEFIERSVSSLPWIKAIFVKIEQPN